MFDVLALLFSWLPFPLAELVFGAFCLLLVFILIKIIGWILDLIPFF